MPLTVDGFRVASHAACSRNNMFDSVTMFDGLWPDCLLGS